MSHWTSKLRFLSHCTSSQRIVFLLVYISSNKIYLVADGTKAHEGPENKNFVRIVAMCNSHGHLIHQISIHLRICKHFETTA